MNLRCCCVVATVVEVIMAIDKPTMRRVDTSLVCIMIICHVVWLQHL
jgi:hypothetical protein